MEFHPNGKSANRAEQRGEDSDGDWLEEGLECLQSNEDESGALHQLLAIFKRV